MPRPSAEGSSDDAFPEIDSRYVLVEWSAGEEFPTVTGSYASDYECSGLLRAAVRYVDQLCDIPAAIEDD